MSNLKEAIQKKKDQELKKNGDILAFLVDFQIKIQELFSGLENKDALDQINSYLKELVDKETPEKTDLTETNALLQKLIEKDKDISVTLEII